MTSLLDPAVLVTVLAALAAGFALGRFTAGGRADPSDVSRMRRQAQARTSTPAQIQAPPVAKASRPSPAPAPDLPPEAISHLRNGLLINAIKVMRDANPGMGLKQAKDAVEDYQRRNGLA